MRILVQMFIYMIFLKISLCAQSEISIQKGIPLVGGEKNQQFFFSSESNQQQYLIQVYQPKTPPPATGYSVIYLLDGNATFPYASIMAQAMDEAFSRTNKVPPLIVAIGYATESLFDIKARSFDYTPPYKGELQQPNNRGSSSYTQGGAEQFYQFIEKELKPIITDKYKIDLKQQTLFGHSYGGLFTLYTFLNHPESFQFYMAASPSIWWNDFYILKQIKLLQPKFYSPTTLWLSVGEIENKDRRFNTSLVQQNSDIEQFAFDLNFQDNLQIKTFNIQNSTHIEALFPALNLAFKMQN
ncbi:alpha/beta hydrolase-fold protein [Arcobacter lacus]|uniref:alpha/beta hydrolase n=1 Tax=Arcobacter lacus TaxID=1912876 RepID=UPI0021BB5712|nr:alpha/beta hydrolase-fold protein [Arcobacter lacus]MCT7909699.1 alpha/beta hydrolase-fold protein [Arcobacter lacus]